MTKDIAIGLLGAIVAVAGLLLVFSGFLFTKAESIDSRRGDKFRTIGKLGVIPLIASFVTAWVCLMAVQDNPWAVTWGILVFKIATAMTPASSGGTAVSGGAADLTSVGDEATDPSGRADSWSRATNVSAGIWSSLGPESSKW